MLSLSLDRTRRGRRRLDARPPRQVLGGQVNEHRPKDHNQPQPETPITMREFPVGAMPLLGTVPIMIGLVGSVIYFIHGLCCFSTLSQLPRMLSGLKVRLNLFESFALGFGCEPIKKYPRAYRYHAI